MVPIYNNGLVGRSLDFHDITMAIFIAARTEAQRGESDFPE
jgi:hypothetical protein